MPTEGFMSDINVVEEGNKARRVGKLGGKLAGLSLPRQIWMISLWPFVEQVLAFFVSAVDLMIASRLGNSPAETIAITNGMGAVAYVAWLGFVMQGAVAMGATALVSRMTGARSFRKANHGANQSLVLGAMAGFCSCLLMYTSVGFLSRVVLKLDDASSLAAIQYMRVMSFAALFSGIVFGVNGALRGAGDTRTPFFIMALINVVNIVASCLYVWGPYPLGGHGIYGVAAGSLTGFLLGAFVLIILLHRRRHQLFGTLPREKCVLDEWVARQHENYVPPLYLSREDLWPDWSMLWRIVRIGGPQAIEIFVIWAIQFYSLRIVSSLPVPGALGAHAIAVRTESMAFLPGFAIGTAASALVGQYLGAGNRRAASLVIKACCQYACIFMGSFAVLFLFFAPNFVTIFASKSPELVHLAAPLLRVAAFGEISFALGIVLKMSLRAAGDVRRVMIISILIMAFWRIVVLTLWDKYFPETLTLTWVWGLFIGDLIMQSVVFWKIYKGNKWTRLKV